MARSPSRHRPRLKGLLIGRVSATILDRAVTTLTVHLTGRGSRLLRRYRALLIRIHLNITQEFETIEPITTEGVYLTRLRAPAP